MDPAALLARLHELLDGSPDYFVSGSFSFLPILEPYRQPEHDLDVAVAAPLLPRLRDRRRSAERLRFLRLREVALAERAALTRLLSPRTAFAHLTTTVGLLDIAFYRPTRAALHFHLGAGFTLDLPVSVLRRVVTLTWQGLSYRAGPVELAFLPKAVAYTAEPGSLAPHHLEDLRRLATIVDWEYLAELIAGGGLRWRGHRLPWPLRGLDPFTARVLALRHALAAA